MSGEQATTEISTLSLHDALPILEAEAADPNPLPPGEGRKCRFRAGRTIRHPAESLAAPAGLLDHERSEEHTSELQSPCNLVCRLLLEKKKRTYHLCRHLFAYE